MGIENLLAQGVEIRPAGMERNALMQFQQFQDAKQRNALMQMQMQDVHAQRQFALEQAKQVAADRARVEQLRQLIPSPQMQASQQALAGGGGPTVGNAAQMRPVDPRLQALHGAMQAGMGTPLDYMKEAYPKDEFETVAPGASRVNKRTNQVAFTAPKEAKLPDGMQMGANGPEWVPGYLEGRGQIARSGASSIVNYGSPVPVELPGGGVGYVQPTNRGGPVAPMTTPGGDPLRKPGEGEKPLTEGQAKAVAFASRMESADKVMTDLSSKGLNKTIPGGMGNNMVGSAITAIAPAQQQQLMQAKRNFINAILRRESGAVISPEEFANAERQYFPQPGEGQEVMGQKARERRVAIEGMRADVPKSRQSEVDRIAGVGSGDSSGSAVQTATNPKTKEKLQLVNGQWVPAK